MQIISAICSTVLLVVMVQVTLIMLTDKYELSFVRYKQVLVSKSVLLISFGTTTIVIYLHALRWESYCFSEMILNVIILWGLAVFSVTDYKNHVIPNKIIALLLMICAVVVGINCLMDIESGIYLAGQCLLGGLISGIVFFVCYFLSKRQLGAGDVKLAVIMGLYLGGQRALNAFLYGTIVCCVYSLVQVARKKLGWKDGVPLVPFLTLGTWIIFLIS